MRFMSLAVVAAVLVVTPAMAKDAKPLPSDIKVITEADAKSCQFVDVVSAMRFAAISASKTSRAALIAALEKAKAAGGNAAVITSTTVSNNQHQFTLTAYRCANAPTG